MSERLLDSFYAQDTQAVARQLLGKRLVRQFSQGGQVAGIIVEVEAYLAEDDAASHSARGPNRKNASMYQPHGTLYVYPIHARYCMNVVTEPVGKGAAVLIRAVEPLEPVAAMQRARSTSEKIRLTTGPAKLCEAMAVDRHLDGHSLVTSSHIWIESEDPAVGRRSWSVRVSPRIGISQARDKLLRWFVDGNRYVSGCARDHTCGRTWQFTE